MLMSLHFNIIASLIRYL